MQKLQPPAKYIPCLIISESPHEESHTCSETNSILWYPTMCCFYSMLLYQMLVCPGGVLDAWWRMEGNDLRFPFHMLQYSWNSSLNFTYVVLFKSGTWVWVQIGCTRNEFKEHIASPSTKNLYYPGLTPNFKVLLLDQVHRALGLLSLELLSSNILLPCQSTSLTGISQL